MDAVMAVTLDSLGFGDLVPGASGTPLEGVSINGLTLMMVPQGKSLSPGDVSIPARIAGNIKQVLDDLAKSQPGRAGAQFDAGVTMLAELDIKGSGGVETLMASAGVGETVLPIIGKMSPQMFDVKADPKLRMKGLSLSMALPKIAVPGLPSSFKLTKPVFNISGLCRQRLRILILTVFLRRGPIRRLGLILRCRRLVERISSMR